MATASVTKASHATLSTTTVDTVNLKQFWDGIEISNRSGSSALYATFSGTAPTAAGDDTDVIEPGITKLFHGHRTGDGVAGSASLPCHVIKIIGSGNAYSVSGVAGGIK